MSEFSNHSPQEALTEDQRAVLDENTRIVLEAGLARHYVDALNIESRFWEQLATLEESKYFGAMAERMRIAASAELPFAFNLQPGNLEASVQLIKVDPNTGKTLEHSEVQVGLFGQLNEGVAPNDRYGFTDEGVKLALERVVIQKQQGLTFASSDRGFGSASRDIDSFREQ